jgi:hypothetical protein
MHRLFAAAQDGGIAGLQAQAGRVRGDVGAGFVNDDDDADGSGNLLESQAVGAGALVEDAAGRVVSSPNSREAAFACRASCVICSVNVMKGNLRTKPGKRKVEMGFEASLVVFVEGAQECRQRRDIGLL